MTCNTNVLCSEHVGEMSGVNNWVSHIDCLLHVCLLEEHQGKELRLPTAIKHVTIQLVPKQGETKGKKQNTFVSVTHTA